MHLKLDTKLKIHFCSFITHFLGAQLLPVASGYFTCGQNATLGSGLWNKAVQA